MEHTAHTLTRTQRLRNMAEALLQACEAQEIPKDIAGITRLARALIVIDRLLTALYAKKPVKTQAQPAVDTAPAPIAPAMPAKAPDLTSQMTALLAARKQSDAAKGRRRGYG